jgi:hypothetical protein
MNNVREFDNRIRRAASPTPPTRALTGIRSAPRMPTAVLGRRDVSEVGAAAVRAEVTLIIRRRAREHVEFLRDKDTTTAAGNILFDLWNDHGKSAPVVMARATFEPDAGKIAKCKTAIARGQESFRKTYAKEWGKCYAVEAQGLTCDSASRNAKIAAAQAKFTE